MDVKHHVYLLYWSGETGEKEKNHLPTSENVSLVCRYLVLARMTVIECLKYSEEPDRRTLLHPPPLHPCLDSPHPHLPVGVTAFSYELNRDLTN